MLALYLATILAAPAVDPGPSAEPITLAEAKKHLRVDSSADNALIEDAIVSAREWVEGYTGVLLTRRVVTERISAFADHTKLRAWPIAAGLPLTLVYRDTAGVTQAIADAQMSAANRPARIYPAAAARWPAAHTVFGDIEVTCTAGFADPADVPMILKRAMLTMLTAFYEDREGGDMFAASEKAAMALCNRGNHRRRTL